MRHPNQITIRCPDTPIVWIVKAASDIQFQLFFYSHGSGTLFTRNGKLISVMTTADANGLGKKRPDSSA